MSIVTREEVKTYLQINNIDSDNLIDMLIPQAEGLFLQVRGVDFFTFCTLQEACISIKIMCLGVLL